MQTIMELFNNKTAFVGNNRTQFKKSNKPKLNPTVERVIFYSMTSFLFIYLCAQYI